MNPSSTTFVTLPDVRIHYALDGEPGKPVLVLSHSLGTNLTMWEGQLPAFTRHFQVLRYDTRGHGQSSVPPGPYTIEQLGRDVVDLLDRLSIESCCYCGLSMGGVTGQWLGVHAAGRLRKLVLCNTAAKIGNAEGWNARIDAVLSNGVEALIPGVLERWYTPSFREHAPAAVAHTRAMLEATDRAGYAACSAAIRDADFGEVGQPDDLRRIPVPTLVIAGTHDPGTPPSDAQFLVSNINGARYVELNASHMSSVEAEAAFNSAVLHFLMQ